MGALNGNGKKWPQYLTVGLISTVFAAGGAWALLGSRVNDAKAVNDTQTAAIKAVETVNQRQELDIQKNKSDIDAERKSREMQMQYIRERLDEINAGIKELRRP